MSSALKEFVEERKCSDIIPPRDLFTCEDSSSLMYVLEHIRRLGVHSLPCVNSQTKQIEGMCDVIDIVCSVYEICDLERFNRNGSFNPGEVASAFIDTSELARALSATTAGQMVSRGARSRDEIVRDQPAHFSGPIEPSPFVTLGDSLKEIITKLGHDKRHRVPVVDQPGSALIQNIITQSDLCGFLLENIDRLPHELRKQEIAQYGSRNLVKLSTTAAIAEALHLFRIKKVHALLVEDRRGHFVGQVTAHSFVSHASNFETFGLAVDEFLRLEGNSVYNELWPETMLFEDALRIICQKRRGRLWLGENGIATTVVSMRDLILAVERALSVVAAPQ